MKATLKEERKTRTGLCLFNTKVRTKRQEGYNSALWVKMFQTQGRIWGKYPDMGFWKLLRIVVRACQHTKTICHHIKKSDSWLTQITHICLSKRETITCLPPSNLGNQEYYTHTHTHKKSYFLACPDMGFWKLLRIVVKACQHTKSICHHIKKSDSSLTQICLSKHETITFLPPTWATKSTTHTHTHTHTKIILSTKKYQVVKNP